MVTEDNIPRQLAELVQWVCWRNENGRKLPVQPNGTPAKSNDASTWCGLDEALEAAPRHTGLGFVFAGGMVGIDLDACYHEGAVDGWAWEILQRFRGTYAEWSPSGTGVHVIAYGSLPGGRGRKLKIEAPKVGDKSPGIEIYEQARYFCFTGQRLPGVSGDVTNQQAAIDWLLSRFDQPVPTAPQLKEKGRVDVPRWLARRGVQVLGTDTQDDGTRRWFIPCPGAGSHSTPSGPRDCVVTQESSGAMGGHCFHASCGMGDWHALSAALGRPEYDDYDDALRPDPGVDLSAIVGVVGIDDDEQEEEESESADAVEPFPYECLRPPGLLSEIVDYTLSTSLYPQPEMALAGALSLLATITGRKVCDHRNTRTNVYILSLSESGTGKEQPRKVNKKLLMLSGGAEMIGSERVGSHAGVVTTVCESPACLMQLDEMGRLLEMCKDASRAPHLYSLITVLMQMFTSSDSVWKADAYADAKKIKTIDQPHLVLYGTATPDSFWGSLSTENVKEGLMGRLLVFEGRGYTVDMNEKIEVFDPPESLLRSIRHWIDFNPGGNLAERSPVPRIVPHSPEALDRLLEHQRGINSRRKTEHPLRAALWSRCGEKSAKLALLHACSRARCVPESIIRADVDWGIRLANWLTRRLLHGCKEHVAENRTEARKKRLLREIGYGGITKTQLTRRTQYMTARERNEALSDLEQSGQIEVATTETGKRPKSIVRRKARKQRTA